MTIDLDAARTTLQEERAKLVHQLEELGATETGELTGDTDFGDGFADAAAATAERTEVMGLVDSLLRNVEAVDRALVKIDEGTYGTCEECGKPIGADRMEFRPTSTLCIDCKAKRG